MISYMGGKYRMAKWISDYVPNNTSLYGEVFGGAFWTYLNSDIFKNKNLKEVHYNDFNRLMVNMFESCRNNKKLLEQIKKDDIKSQDSKKFIEFRDEVYKLEDSGEINKIKMPDYKLAYKYPYLLTQVFSGSAIKKNTKMMDLKGKYKSKFNVFTDRLENPVFIEKLSKITECHNLDFEKLVNKLDREDAFLYFDPPYYNTEDYYGFHEFGREDHLRLADTLKNMKGFWALSYYEFDDLNKWFPRDEYIWIEKEFVKAASAKKGVEQNKGKEVLIMNYSIELLPSQMNEKIKEFRKEGHSKSEIDEFKEKLEKIVGVAKKLK